MKVLSDISVHDCDHGVNGRILLSTSTPDFRFKISNVYKEGKPGLEMKKPFDFEKQNLTEFTVFARGDAGSTNNFNTSALVI